MKRVLLLYHAYPFAIASYFRHALEKRPDVELYTCGAFTNDIIPWGGGMRLPAKYVKPLNLPMPPSIVAPTWQMIAQKTQRTFDLILNIDAGYHLADKPDMPYAVVATDPHALKDVGWYTKVRPNADYFFNMQKYDQYQLGGDIHLPYACSPDHHFAMSDVQKEYDACLIGLHYEQRTKLVSALRQNGYKVFYELGLIYDEYRWHNNKSRIGLNWSNQMDINARTFEIMAMRLVPVINRLPHLDDLGFEEGRHYLGFENIDEAVEQVRWAFANPETSDTIANNAYQLVHEKHTYDLRVQQIFDAVGL